MSISKLEKRFVTVRQHRINRLRSCYVWFCSTSIPSSKILVLLLAGKALERRVISCVVSWSHSRRQIIRTALDLHRSRPANSDRLYDRLNHWLYYWLYHWLHHWLDGCDSSTVRSGTEAERATAVETETNEQSTSDDRPRNDKREGG